VTTGALELLITPHCSSRTRHFWPSGYETPKGESHHFRVIESLAMTIGAADSLVRNFNGFRKMRNAGVYERAGVVSRDNAKEMLEMAKELHETVAKWLRAHHPELV